MMEKKNNRLENINNDLKSGNKEKIISAVSLLRQHGQKESIDELLSIFIETTDEEIKKSISNLLFDLKDEKVVLPILKAITNKKYASIKPFLISIFWQSSLDASEHLGSLVRIAVNGNFQTCLEVLTVIENFETSFDEEKIMDAVFDIEEKLDDYEIDEDYRKLLFSLKDIVSALRTEI